MAKTFTALAEGDSWFNLPDFPIGLPIVGGTDTDLVRELQKRGHRIDSIAHFGDTLTDIASASDYVTALENTHYDAFLLCGSGNDLLGGGDMWKYLQIYHFDWSAEKHVKRSFEIKLLQMEMIYQEIIELALERSRNKKLRIVSHGYDYAIPQKRGYWLGEPMKRQGIVKAKLQQEIVRIMIDELYSMLNRLSRQYKKSFTYVDFRKTVGKRWHDELHPRKAAFSDLAEKLETRVKKVL
ncbi:hypothetical protein [Roseibium sp. M-1]